jgi:hypothetical protein
VILPLLNLLLGGGGGGGGGESVLLLEDGTNLLLEDGTNLLLEDSGEPSVDAPPKRGSMIYEPSRHLACARD